LIYVRYISLSAKVFPQSGDTTMTSVSLDRADIMGREY